MKIETYFDAMILSQNYYILGAPRKRLRQYRAFRARILRMFEECEPKCHRCGKRATIWTLSPFMAELHPEDDNPEEWWCDECQDEDWANI